MSADYNAFLGIGKRFLDKKGVIDFLDKNTNLLKEEIEAMLDGETNRCMSVECLDCYSGQDWFVGFEVGGDAPDTLIINVVDTHERWDEIVQDCPARVVHAVKIW